MYKKINKLDPARLDIYEKLAELYVKQQLWMEAKSNYQVLADYLLKQDNLGGTIGIYQKMVAIEPQNLQLHVKLADLFTQAKRIPEALREYGVVAGALAERGAHEESIRVYEKALRLAPDNVEILRTLVPLLLSINSVDPARAVLRKGLEASPRSVALFLLAADAALAANDMAEARSFSDKARAVEPDNEDVLAAVVKIQLKGRRPDLAWAAAAPLADAAVRKGEAKKALALLVPIARAAPDVDDLVKKIVDIASGIGDEADRAAVPVRPRGALPQEGEGGRGRGPPAPLRQRPAGQRGVPVPPRPARAPRWCRLGGPGACPSADAGTAHGGHAFGPGGAETPGDGLTRGPARVAEPPASTVVPKRLRFPTSSSSTSTTRR